MNWRPNALKIGVILLSVICAVGCYLLCENNVLSEIRSPDGSLKAVVFIRNCGATTSYTTNVSILETNQGLPRGHGNVFMGDANHGAAPSGGKGELEVAVEWVDKSNLLISHDLRADVILLQPSMQSAVVTIEERLLEIPRCSGDGELLTSVTTIGPEEYCVQGDGTRYGLLVGRYPDGRKREAGNYGDGKKEGVWTTWLANGTQESLGEYVSGMKEGVWSEYLIEQAEVCVGWYRNGEKQPGWRCTALR